MKFFNELSAFLSACNLKITLSKKGEKITVGIFPDAKDEDVTEKLKPMCIVGTAEELDEKFLEVIKPAVESVTGVISNLENYDSELKKLEDEKKKKVEQKKPAAPAAKKVASDAKKLTPNASKSTPDAKPEKADAPKPEEKKPAAKPKTEKKLSYKEIITNLIAEKKFNEAEKQCKKADDAGGVPKAKIQEWRDQIAKADSDNTRQSQQTNSAAAPAEEKKEATIFNP